jgi:cytoskeletal protein CcmA (bactofilin family)
LVSFAELGTARWSAQSLTPGGSKKKTSGIITPRKYKMDNTINNSEDLMFNGKLNGDIAAEGELTLGPRADIHGEVRAKSLKLSGRVRGNVYIGDTCRIFSSAVLIGDLEANRLVLDEGASFLGQSRVAPTQVSELATGNK